jgi:alpha-tubulin suppressor-like RCC1 family protein
MCSDTQDGRLAELRPPHHWTGSVVVMARHPQTLRTTRPRVRVVVALCAFSILLVGACEASDVYGLPMQRAGRRCSGNGFARDSKNVLQCVKGRWKVNMTIDRAVAMINAYNAAQATTTPVSPPQTPETTVLPPPPPPVVPQQIALGNAHTCVLLTDGFVKCWGANDQGQLGIGSFSSRLEPTEVVGLVGAVQISAARDSTCAVRGDGSVACWGDGSRAQLGIGFSADSPVPLVVPNVMGAVQVAVGVDHSCALLGDATVKCWGSNVAYQLGDGTASGRLTAVVANASQVAQLNAGALFTCARTLTGTVTCWGYSSTGRLGNGSPSQPTMPEEVPGVSGVTDLSAGDNHACAVAAGVVRCWGYNEFGGLGDGSNVNRYSPVTVSSLSAVSKVTAGRGFSCAVTTTVDSVQCWGANSLGTLGDGTTINSNTPVRAGSLSGVAQLEAGDDHVCALKTDSTLRCWGSNSRGQLGLFTPLGYMTTPTGVIGFS